MIPKSKRLRVRIPALKTLRIYNPNGKEHPVISGAVVLEGVRTDIRGNTWLIFQGQRGYGLPLKRRDGEDDHIDVDLEEAVYFGDITIESIPQARRNQGEAA